MNAFVRDLLEPLPHLTVYIRKIHKRPQRPEALPQIANPAPLDLALFPSGSRIAGPRVKAKHPRKGQESGIELDDSAIMLGYRGPEIVV
jgi:hypothetical protein